MFHLFQGFLGASTGLKQFYGSSASWGRDNKTFYKRDLGLFFILYNFAFMKKIDLRPLNGTSWILSQEQEQEQQEQQQQQQQQQRRVVLDLLFAGKKKWIFDTSAQFLRIQRSYFKHWLQLCYDHCSKT